MTPQQRQRRRGLVELVLGALCLVVTLSAAAGDAPEYVIPVTAVATVFMFGAAYSDIRGKASAAHKRLDRMEIDAKDAAEKLNTTLSGMSTQITNLRIDLATRGIVAREHPE